MKTIRRYLWLLTALFTRYQKTVFFGFLIGIFIFISASQIVPFLKQRLSNQQRIIGMVGFYTPSSLPISVQRLISTGLTDIDNQNNITPAVALSWSVSEDGKTYTFSLRDDVRWHDGKILTAEDVNYNLKDVEIKVPAEHTLEIKLKEPFAPLPSVLSRPLFRKGLVGVGPYKVGSIKLKGEFLSYLSLIPQTPDLPPLVIKFYNTESIAKTAFKLGEVNVLDEMHNADDFVSWPTVNIKEIPNQRQFVAVFFNTKNNFLSKKEIRQALSYLVEKQEKNRIATPIATNSWAYTNQVKQYDKDEAAAKKLLKDIKKEEPLLLSTFPQYENLAKLIAAAWNSAGIKTEVQVTQQFPSNFEAFLATQEIGADPDEYALWHSTQVDTNITGYNSAKIDKLLEDGRKVSDTEARKKIYFDFQRYLVEDSPAIFLFHPSTYTISRT